MSSKGLVKVIYLLNFNGSAKFEGHKGRKGGNNKSFSHAEGGGGTTSFGVVFMRY